MFLSSVGMLVINALAISLLIALTRLEGET